MASTTWRNWLRRIPRLFVSPHVIYRRPVPRLIPSQTNWKVYKLNTSISQSTQANSLYRLFLYKLSKNIPLLASHRGTVMSADENKNDVGDQTTQPPESVRGMTKLDRSAFRQIVKVPAIKVPLKHVALLGKHLKKSLAKFTKVKPISELSDDDPHRKDHRLFLFNPEKYKNVGSFSEEERKLLEEVDINLETAVIWVDIELGYDNWSAAEILRAVLPGSSDNVSGFSNIGHIAHLNLRDDVLDYKYLIGEVILDKVPTVKTVVNKLNVIDNTFRNFQMELLAGEEDFNAVVRENKCVYQFDFSKVYWNSRLGIEHERIVTRLNRGDVVYDVFAGVGPFAIPAAKKGCVVLANDLNPESYKSLVSNGTLNKIKTVFETFNLDGREFINNNLKGDLVNRWKALANSESNGNSSEKSKHTFHIIMNLPAIAIEFMDTFKSLFDHISETMVMLDPCYLPHVYCYCFYKGDNPEEDVRQRVLQSLGCSVDVIGDIEIRLVRNVAPNKDMYCVEFVTPKALLCQTMVQTTESNTGIDSSTDGGPEVKRRRTDSTEKEL